MSRRYPVHPAIVSRWTIKYTCTFVGWRSMKGKEQITDEETVFAKDGNLEGGKSFLSVSVNDSNGRNTLFLTRLVFVSSQSSKEIYVERIKPTVSAPWMLEARYEICLEISTCKLSSIRGLSFRITMKYFYD